jgi:hypothetical protein
MDYIDWLISSVLFITVISLVLVALFNILPISGNSNNNVLSDSLYKSTISDIIPVYNISVDSEDSEIYPYFISDINYGRAGNTFAIDTNNNSLFGLVYDKDKFYNYETDINALSGLGVQMLFENFNDFNYTDTFDLNSGIATIKSGILELNSNTIIDTTSEFSKYLGSFITTAEDINVYINFDTATDRYYCNFNEAGVTLISLDSSSVVEKNNTTPKNTEWRKLNFGYYRDFNNISWFFCGIGDDINLIKTNNETHPGDAAIRIATIDDQTYIDDFSIYKSLINATDHNGTMVKTDSLGTTVTTSGDMRFDFYTLSETDAADVLEYIMSISDFGGDLNNYNEGPVKLFSNTTNQNRLVFFPMAKEFWIYKYIDEDPITIRYQLEENSKPHNFGSATENGQFTDLRKLSKSYAVPISFVSEKAFSIEDYISFDVDFNRVFSEITPASGSEAPIIQYCKFDECIDVTLDSNFIFDTDTNTAEVVFKFPEANAANQPFHIIIEFDYDRFIDLQKTTGEATPIEGSQLTARVASEDITIDTNQFYLYNIFNSSYPGIKQTIIFDVFDNAGLHTQDCNFFMNYGSQNILITCDKNSLIKVRYRFTNLENTILEYPKMSITKTNERIITQDGFENLSCGSFYANIKNKTLDLNCNSGVNSEYKAITKYLYNNGILENAKIFVKTYN